MKRKNQFSTSNKYWLLILAIVCIVLMGLSGFAESGKGPLSWAAGYTIVPMQKGINRVGMWIGDVSENFATLQESGPFPDSANPESPINTIHTIAEFSNAGKI